jgi:hypothetical protein
MSIQCCKDEINSMSDFQKDIHLTSDYKEKIISNFYQKFLKSTWYSSIDQKLKQIKDGDETAFIINNSFHYLIYTYMRFYLPPIRVKEKYKDRVKICWCHNVGINRIKKASFKDEDEDYQSFDNTWLDIYFQFYQNKGSGKRKAFDRGVGNVSFLETWSDFLPSFPINVEQPWYYSSQSSLAYPIFYKNSLSRAEHRYVFRSLHELLRIKILNKNGEWVEISRNNDLSEAPNKYVDFLPCKKSTNPELWGKYAYVTNNEIEWNKECSDDKVFYIRDIEICDSITLNKYNSISTIELNCKNPCLAMFWVAENMNSSKKCNFSNYTTDSSNLYIGWDPVSLTTLKYGNDSKFENFESDHFNIGQTRKHFPSYPSDQGYHTYSFAWDSTNYNGDIGICLSNLNSKLLCELQDGNLFSLQNLQKIGEIENEDSELYDPNRKNSVLVSTVLDPIQEPEFLVRVRLLIIKKFTISKNELDGKFNTRIE